MVFAVVGNVGRGCEVSFSNSVSCIRFAIAANMLACIVSLLRKKILEESGCQSMSEAGGLQCRCGVFLAPLLKRWSGQIGLEKSVR